MRIDLCMNPSHQSVAFLCAVLLTAPAGAAENWGRYGPDAFAPPPAPGEIRVPVFSSLPTVAIQAPLVVSRDSVHLRAWYLNCRVCPLRAPAPAAGPVVVHVPNPHARQPRLIQWRPIK